MTEFNTEDGHDWSEFKPEPEKGDVKILNDHIKRATEIQEGLKKLDQRASTGKQLLKTLLEKEIPDLMARCGFDKGDSVNIGGVKVEVKHDYYCNVPSISSIEDEKDDERRAELLDRRLKGLAILEAEAPALIKRKFEFEFEKDEVEEARAFEQWIDSLENVPTPVKGLTVHPATLSKWVNEKAEGGHSWSDEAKYAFGIYPRRIAKIKK